MPLLYKAILSYSYTEAFSPSMLLNPSTPSSVLIYQCFTINPCWRIHRPKNNLNRISNRICNCHPNNNRPLLNSTRSNRREFKPNFKILPPLLITPGTVTHLIEEIRPQISLAFVKLDNLKEMFPTTRESEIWLRKIKTRGTWPRAVL